MVTIEWTDEAEYWLKEIHDYIAHDNAEIAKRVIKDIYHKVQILRTFPRIGYLYESIEEQEVRILFYGHYRIAYHIKSETAIDILGIFHGALDIEHYLVQ